MDWSIKIVPATTQSADASGEFVPDVPGAKAGDPLKALPKDSVSWNNKTEDAHRPWPTDENYVPLPDSEVLPRGSAYYLSDRIPPKKSSHPGWIVVRSPVGDGGTMYYCCKQHPNEHGRIVITTPTD